MQYSLEPNNCFGSLFLFLHSHFRNRANGKWKGKKQQETKTDMEIICCGRTDMHTICSRFSFWFGIDKLCNATEIGHSVEEMAHREKKKKKT